MQAMSIRSRGGWAVIAALLVNVGSIHAQDAFVQEKSSGIIKVTSCTVASVRDKSIHQD